MQWTLAFEQGNYRRGQISLVSHCSITGDSAGYGIAVQQGPYRDICARRRFRVERVGCRVQSMTVNTTLCAAMYSANRT